MADQIADNFVTDAGAGGNTYASDDVTGVHYPILKLAHGALDSVTIVSTASGLPTQVTDGVNIVEGALADAAVAAGGTGSISAKLRAISRDLVANIVLAAGTAAIGKLAANSGVDIGDVDVLSIAAGTALIGDVGLQPRTSGGLTLYKTIDLDETEEEVKATAGQIYALHVMNLTASLLYFKIYNATAANVIVGTTVPDITIPVPGDNNSDGAGFVWSVPQGIAFGTAITIACTTGVADADAGAPAANACVATVLYK